MKRPAGLWLLLSVGVLSLIFRNASGIRATSLIFSKSTSTTTESNDGDENSPLSEEAVTEANTENSNTTKPTLTGNPQIDYVHDPNLPQELNGYNLSEYPFYERVPDSEEFDFKCDGLHDGFYASIPHKCQVYHHCLFGTRYDFLCANYTAFDQRTFICQFVSEVDCVNSKKFWHRNDALYQAASTTTVKPQVTFPPPSPIPPQKQDGHPTGEAPFPPSRPTGMGFGGGRRRYPPRRRRPQYDYYYDDDYEDDYYDDPPPRRRRVRPRRPVYEDEYDYDEKTASRSHGDEKRRPYDRRRPDMRRNKDRRKHDDDPDYDTEEDEKKRPGIDRRRRPNEKRRLLDDEYDRRIERPRKGSRRPAYDDEYEEDYIDNNERANKKSNVGHDSENKDKSVKPIGGSSIFNRPRIAPKIKPPVPKNEANKFSYSKNTPKITTTNTRNDDYYDYEEKDEEKLLDNDNSQIKPSQKEEHRITEKQIGAASRNRNHSMRPDYDEYDHKPKLDSVRSVTRNGQNSSKSRRREPQIEYDDDYYEDISGKERNKMIKDKPLKEYSEEVISEPSTTKRYERPMYTKIRRPTTTVRYDQIRNASEKVTPSLAERESELNKHLLTTESPKLQDSTVKQEKGSRNKNDHSMYRNKYDISTRTSTEPATVSSVQPENSKTNHIRIIKRPFLPSRGGNPYVPRGLQPIGLKVEENITTKDIKPSLEELFPINNNREIDKEKRIQSSGEETRELPEKPFKASPIILKVPASKYIIPKGSENENEKPKLITLLRQDYREEISQESAGDERVPLDIYDTEYDVTLNDALNPTLPNIPLYKDGYSHQPDYYRRNRYLVDPIVQSTNINQHQVPYYQQSEQFSNPGRTQKFTVSPVPIGYSLRNDATQINNQMKTTPAQHQHTQAFYTSY